MALSVQTRFDTTLNGAITSTATTAVLDAAPAFTTGYGTFERGEALEEDFYWGGLTGLQVTGLLRGLSQTALTVTEVGGNKQAHADGVQVEGTLLHYIVNNKADLDEDETYTGTNTFADDKARSTTNAAPSNDLSFTNKKYADDQLALKGDLSGGNTWAGVQIFADDGAESTTNAAPTSDKKLANKKYVDDQVAAAANSNVAVSGDDTTPGNLEAKIVGGTHVSFTTNNPAGNETRQIDLDAIQSSSGSGSANALVATASDGFIHPSFRAREFTAYEAISQDDAVALKSIEVEYFSQLTDVNLALGDANARRRYAIKIIPSVTSSSLTTMLFRAAEAVNGATTLGNLTISIQGDNAGEPDGSAITNGTANVITQATQRTWNTTQANRTATWASPPTLTAGTTYWIVFEVDATDGTNYLNLGENSTYDENYLTFTRLTYDLDAGTWGGSVTNATPFFWFNNQTKLLGMALCPTDANFGGRTWPFVGFAKAAISANATGVVYRDTVPDLASLTPNTPYFISATAGEITSSKPANVYDGNSASYKIGDALEDGTTLCIARGKKMYFGILEPTGSATTTHQIIPWFDLAVMELAGSYLSTAAILDTTVKGIYDGNNNYLRSTRVTNGGNPSSTTGTGGTKTTKSFGHDTGAYWQGVGSAKTDVGFTYTVTKTGTPADYEILYTVEGN